MQIGYHEQLVRDPLDHHVGRLNQARHPKLLCGLKGKLAVVLDVVGTELAVRDQIGVETVDQSTERQPIAPTCAKICHLDVGVVGADALRPLEQLLCRGRRVLSQQRVRSVSQHLFPSHHGRCGGVSSFKASVANTLWTWRRRG